MDTKSRGVILLSCLVSAFVYGSDISLCGSEGPRPLSFVAPTADVTEIPTVNGVRDFAVSEKAIYYRNFDNKIFVRDSEEELLLTQSAFPLSRILDPLFRVLLVEGADKYFHFMKNKWVSTGIPRESHPIFWDHNDFYSAVQAAPNEIQIYRTHLGQDESRLWCRIRDKKLIHGHKYPWVYSYSSAKSWDGWNLYIHHLNIQNCQTQSYQYQKIVGPIEDVYKFEPYGATAARIKHPDMNLFWDDDKQGCRYYNVGNETPLITNSKVALVGGWSKTDGLTVIDPITERISYVFKPPRVRKDITENDLFIADKNTVYLSPTLRRTKPLLKIKLN